jgi:hypothetical protein
MKRTEDNLQKLSEELLANIKKNLPELEKLLKEVEGHWAMEDLIYRQYHYSFKVYYIQDYTIKIVEALKKLAPKGVAEFNSMFDKIYKEGTGKTFKMEHNDDWLKYTRPMIEAFFHAQYFLQMAVKYSKLDKAPECLPSGWALLLCYFNLR